MTTKVFIGEHIASNTKYKIIEPLPIGYLYTKSYKKPLTLIDYYGKSSTEIRYSIGLKWIDAYSSVMKSNVTGWGNPHYYSQLYQPNELQEIIEEFGLILDNAKHLIYLPTGLVLGTNKNPYNQNKLNFRGHKKDNKHFVLNNFWATSPIDEFKNITLEKL